MAKLEHVIEERARRQILTWMRQSNICSFLLEFFSAEIWSQNKPKINLLTINQKRLFWYILKSETWLLASQEFGAQETFPQKSGPELMDVIEESRAKIQSKTKNATYKFSRTITYTYICT